MTAIMAMTAITGMMAMTEITSKNESNNETNDKSYHDNHKGGIAEGAGLYDSTSKKTQES